MQVFEENIFDLAIEDKNNFAKYREMRTPFLAKYFMQKIAEQ